MSSDLHPPQESDASSRHPDPPTELTSLLEMARAIASSPNPDEALRQVATIMARAFGLPRCSLAAYDPEAAALRFLAVHCDDAESAAADGPAIVRLTDDPALARVLRTGELIVLRADDPTADPASVARLREVGDAVTLLLPLCIHGSPTGLAELGTRDPRRHFTPDEVRRARSLADQAASAVQIVRWHAETERRLHEVLSLHDAGRALNSDLSLDSVLNRLADHMLSLLGADTCTIATWDASRGERVVMLDRDPSPEARIAAGSRFPVTQTSPAAIAMRQGKTLAHQRDDPALDETLRQALDRYQLQSLLTVPLISQGAAIGSVQLGTRQSARTFLPDEIRLAESLAGSAATAIENARLHAAEQARARRQAALFQLSRDLSGLLDERAMCDRAVRGLGEILGFEFIALLMIDPASGEREVVGLHGMHPSEVPSRLPPGKGLSAMAARAGRLQYTPDVRLTPEVIPGMPDTQSEVNVPIRLHGRVHAILSVESKQRDGFSSEDLDTLQAAAELIELGLERSRLYAAEQNARLAAAALRDATAALNTSLRLDEVLRLILTQLRNVVPFESCALFLIEADHIRVVASEGHPNPEAVAAVRVRLADDRLFSEIASRRAPIVLADARSDPRFSGHGETGYVRGWMGIPMVLRDSLIGCLTLDSPTVAAYGPSDVDLAVAFAAQAALAIENARLYESERRRASQLGLLYEISQQVVGTLDEKELLGRAVQAIVARYGYAEASVSVPAGEDELVIVAIEVTEELGFHIGFRQKVGEGVVGRTAAIRVPYLASDIAADPYYLSTRGPKSGSALGLPLLREDRLLGVLYLESRAVGAFHPEDVRALQTLANHVAIAMENARLYAGARRRLDEITALQSVAQAVTGSLELGQIFQTVVTFLRDHFGYRYVSLYRLDGDDLRLGAQAGYPDKRIFRTLPISRGVMGRSVRKRRVQFVHDVSADPDFLRGMPDVTSEICVPLLKGREVLGTLNVESGDDQPLTRADVNLLSALAKQVTVAIDHARLYQAEREQRQMAEALAEAGAALSASLDLQEVLDRLLDQVRRVVPFDSACVILAESGRGMVARMHGYEKHGPSVVQAVAAASFDVAATRNLREMAETGEPLFIADTSAYEGWVHLQGWPHVRSWVGAPIQAGGRLLGFFSLDKAGVGNYGPHHADLLSAFAGQAALAIENATLYRDVSQQATTDWITGAYNRRHFEKQLAEEVSRGSRLGYPVSLLMGDLDHFKSLNDTHGHPEGDRALRAVSDTLRSELRLHDALYRYGGEEFAIILPGCGHDSLFDAADRLRRAVEAMEFEVGGGRWSITISLGGATTANGCDDPKALLATADSALYRAKHEGRNCVRMG